jgi:hypothetical protein
MAEIKNTYLDDNNLIQFVDSLVVNFTGSSLANVAVDLKEVIPEDYPSFVKVAMCAAAGGRKVILNKCQNDAIIVMKYKAFVVNNGVNLQKLQAIGYCLAKSGVFKHYSEAMAFKFQTHDIWKVNLPERNEHFKIVNSVKNKILYSDEAYQEIIKTLLQAKAEPRARKRP